MFEEVKELLISMLNSSFSAISEKSRNRKIIFWYDAKKDYEELLDELELEDTEIIKYDNNSLWIRYHIEKEELNKNIVIYLPFERQKGVNIELLDIETANSDLIFNPDSTTMRLKNLGLSDECRVVIKKYNRFFNNKIRENDFKVFDIEDKNSENIDYIITAILLGIKSINIDDIIKNIIKIYYDDKKRYEALFKFGNEEFILNLINKYFGSKITSTEEMENVFKSLVFTYFAASISNINKLNRYGKYLLQTRVTNSQVFVNNLMRDKSTKKYFELISNDISKEFGIEELISTMDIEEYKNADAFSIIDSNIILYIVNQLFNSINEFDKYNELITLRESKYWYDKYYNEYNFLKVVSKYFEVVNRVQTSIKTFEIEKFVELYTNELYLVDTLYRKMYYFFDNIRDKDNFINLKNKVENNYTNTYMLELSLKWSDTIENLNRYDANKLTMQNKFFDKYIKSQAESSKNGRTIVIISDAFRYECAKELNEKLKVFGTKSDIYYMLGLVPSYTQLGMAALLPNKELSRDPNYKDKGSDSIFVDGMNSVGIENREKILTKVVPEGLAIQFEELYAMTKSEW